MRTALGDASGQAVFRFALAVIIAGVVIFLQRAFLASLRIAGLPKTDLRALYQALIERVEALAAALTTGTFAPPATVAAAASRRAALRLCADSEARLTALRAEATRESQLGRRVELNLALRALDAEIAAARKDL